MPVSLIVALDENGLIGRGNQLPWRLPADLKHFKRITMGHPVIMGRKTYESIGKPLPGRRNIVLTRQRDFHPDGVEVAGSVDEVAALLQPADEAMVIGGAEVYQAFWPLVTKAYVTVVHHVFAGDTWFPEWPLAGWRLTASELREADEANPYRLRFMEFEKVEKDLSMG